MVIIGGGIHGAGVLQAAVAAGHTALLIERQALAAGTSSRSSKLIHGGLRYLESGQFSLVRESLRERAIHLRIAPDLVALKPFYIPVYRDTRRRPWQLKIGLWIYALLGGFDAATRFGSVPKSEWPQLDGLKTQDLDDCHPLSRRSDQRCAVDARRGEIGPESWRRARHAGQISGARCLSDDGVVVSYGADGATAECKARVLVNAAGPWATQVARAVEPAIAVPDVELVQGAHIVIAHPLTAGIYYVESPTDGRAVFVMPWGGATLVGTTETPYHGDPDQVHPLAEEEEYLLAVVRHYFPALSGLTRDDISQRFAGLRVLPAASQAAFDRSRETIFTTDRDVRPRVLCIYGGKLTGWRAAAAHVMQLISPSLPASEKRAETDLLILRRPT